jgi:transcription elongation factor SPT5
VRPLQAPFDPVKLHGAGHQSRRQQFPRTGEMCDFFENNFYSKGFLIKELKIDLYINDVDVTPRLEELTMYRQQGGAGGRRRGGGGGGSDEELEDEEEDGGSVFGQGAGEAQQSIMEELAELQAGQNTAHGAGTKVSIYRPGDVVQITGGELAGLKGRVISISDATRLMKLKPLHDQLALSEMEVEISDVVKYIQPGSHVKVIDGAHAGETGRVVVVNKVDGDHIAALFTDGIKKEITVNVAHLQVSNEVTIGLNSLEGYELYDFVTLDSNDCGVVVMVGTEQLIVLNGQSAEKTLRPMEVRGKANMQSQRASSLDNLMNVMKAGDTVTVMDGEHAKKTGTIKHIHKSTVWLHCDTYFKHSGIFPVRGRSCSLAGSTARSRGNEGMAPPSGRGAGRGGAGRGGGGRGAPRDEAIGKTVRITKGGFKGHLGVVREKTDNVYSIELAARFKVVKVPASDVSSAVGDSNGSFDRAPATGQGAETPHLQGMTPHMGASTPLHAAGSQTPMHGAGDGTPNAYGYGSQSPHHSMGSQSPHHSMGSQSPHHSMGSQSPHHSMGSQSPHHSSAGYQPSGGDGTPHGEHGGSTTPQGAGAGVGGGRTVEDINWDAGMLAAFTQGDRAGQMAVLCGRVNQVGSCKGVLCFCFIQLVYNI